MRRRRRRLAHRRRKRRRQRRRRPSRAGRSPASCSATTTGSPADHRDALEDQNGFWFRRIYLTYDHEVQRVLLDASAARDEQPRRFPDEPAAHAVRQGRVGEVDQRQPRGAVRHRPDAKLRVRRERLGLSVRREDTARSPAVGQLARHRRAGTGRARQPHALQRSGGQRQRRQRRDGRGQGLPRLAAPRDRQGPHRRGLRRLPGSPG